MLGAHFRLCSNSKEWRAALMSLFKTAVSNFGLGAELNDPNSESLNILNIKSIV